MFSGLKITNWRKKGDVDSLYNYFLEITDRQRKKTDSDLQQQNRVIETFGEIGGEKAANVLATIVKPDSFRYPVKGDRKILALRTLGKLDPHIAVPVLDLIFEDEQHLAHGVFPVLVEILLTNMGEDGQKVIKKRINTFYESNCQSTIEKIVEINDAHLFHLLSPLLKSTNSKVKSAALEALLIHPETVKLEELLSLLDDSSNYSNSKTIYILLNKKGWKPDNQEAIIKRALLLEDTKPLVEIGREDISILLKRLTRNEIEIKTEKINIIKALGELGDPVALPDLINRIEANEYNLSREAITALDKIGDEKAGPTLVSAYQSHIKRRYGSSADLILDVLAKHGWGVDFLIEMLMDSKKENRVKCAKSLVNLYKQDRISQSVKDKIQKQQEVIATGHNDKSWHEHDDNGVRPKTRTHDCGHDDYQRPRHTDEGIGVKFPLV